MSDLRSFLSFKFGGHISALEKINFARHLSIVIKSGVPILEGLKIIHRQTESKALQSIIKDVISDISNGQFLAASLERYGRDVFGNFFINIVRVGEASGTLAQNLAYLAEEMRHSQELRSKVRSAMVYPLIVFFMTVAITVFLVFFVFPKVIPLFASLNVPLPTTTKILIAVSQFLLTNGLWVLLGVVVLIVLVKILLSSEPISFFFDRLKFYVPVVAGLTVDINMANLSRVLGVLLKGGIKIVEAVTITSDTMDNLVYRRMLLKAADEVKRGEPLARYFFERRDVVPPLLAGLVEIGENTGNLEDNLFYLADYYREEVEGGLRTLTSVLEPILLLVMGLVVGFVAISIITPIYQITQGVH